MSDKPILDDLIVAYIRRMPATVNNVASHFGLTKKAAHDALVALEDAGRIQPVGMSSWKLATPAPSC